MAALEGPILFASGANSGLINPLLAVVGELSRRGVEGLHFAADEPARRPVEAAAAGSPIAFHPHAEQVAPLGDATYRAMTRGPGTTDGVVALVRQFRSPAVTEALFRRTLELIDRHRPRLMVIDVLSVGALDAAQRRGVPYVLSVSCPPSTVFVQRLPRDYPTPLTGLPLRMNRRQQISSLAFRVRLALAMLRTVDISDARRRKAEGIVNPYGDIERYAADAVSVFSYTVFGLEYPFPVPPRLHLLGPALPTSPDRPSGELADWLDRHESVVYVNMGTVSQLSAGQLGEIAAALGRIAGSHAVLWKLRDEQRALLPDVLPDAIRVTPWVPTQAEVLGHPHVRAVICHGGNNILHESIAYGQPVLVMPFWLDCYDLATRAADAGVGLAVDRPPHFDADEIVSKVARLLVDDAFRSRSRHWAGELRRAGGAARAADLIMGRSADSRPRHVATAEGGHRRGTMSATAIRPGAE